MEWIIIIIVYLALLFGVYKFALHNNREPVFWVFLAFIVNPLLILLIIALMPKGKYKLKTKKKVRKRR